MISSAVLLPVGGAEPFAVAAVGVAVDNGGLVRMLNTDAAGNLKVSVTGAGSGGTSSVDESNFAEGVTAGTGIMGAFNDALAALSSGKMALARLTAYRAVHSNLRNNSGSEVGTLAAPLRTDPTGTTVQPVSGSLTLTPQTSSTCTTSQITVGTTATSLLAANSSRKKFKLQNQSQQAVKILYGTGITGTNYGEALAANGNVADGSSRVIEDDVWLGAVQAIVPSGSALVTVEEFT
jgi:hypothetical protein